MSLRRVTSSTHTHCRSVWHITTNIRAIFNGLPPSQPQNPPCRSARHANDDRIHGVVAAIIGMTKSSSKDLAPYNIRVNAISPGLIGPGFMWTRQNELHAAANSPYFAKEPEVVGQNKINSVPMKRLGSIEEVINAVAFLFSDKSSYTTGSNLEIAGGFS